MGNFLLDFISMNNVLKCGKEAMKEKLTDMSKFV